MKYSFILTLLDNGSDNIYYLFNGLQTLLFRAILNSLIAIFFLLQKSIVFMIKFIN